MTRLLAVSRRDSFSSRGKFFYSKCELSLTCQRIGRRKSLSFCQSAPDVNSEPFPTGNEPHKRGFTGYMDRVCYSLSSLSMERRLASMADMMGSSVADRSRSGPTGIASPTCTVAVIGAWIRQTSVRSSSKRSTVSSIRSGVGFDLMYSGWIVGHLLDNIHIGQ